jgi:hypothetical protein
MATGIIRRGNHGYENLFFSSMAGVFLVSVFIGFARTYYLAGLFRAPLPNLLVHIHGAVFSAWILLLITKIAGRRPPGRSASPTGHAGLWFGIPDGGVGLAGL